jgi:UDP-3-O-acyl-N-acetylglucosamine deacetylase
LKFTWYYVIEVAFKRPYLKDEWCEFATANPVRTQVQENGRIRHWAFVEELGKYIRAVTLADGETVHNAFPDSGFRE